MSGTRAGALRGWKTRTGQLPPVSAGRQKSPIRQRAGEQAHRTRKMHEGNRAGAVRVTNTYDKTTARMLVRGQISGAAADARYKHSAAEYERQLRANPVRHRSHKGRGR